jgi:hypothetical protein
LYSTDFNICSGFFFEIFLSADLYRLCKLGTIEKNSIFSNSSHLEWRVGLSDTNLKGNHPGSIPARFGLIWFSGFRGEDLNVIFYQNMKFGWDGPWVGPFQNCVRQLLPPFKMAAVTKNRNFFNCPLLLYYKSHGKTQNIC